MDDLITNVGAGERTIMVFLCLSQLATLAICYLVTGSQFH